MPKAKKGNRIRPDKSLKRNARIVLPARIDEVYSWAPFVSQPERSQELHRLRISVKRLRYSMELFAVCYGEEFGAYLRTLAKWQRILGDIHDYDVIEATLTEYLDEIGNDAESADGIAGLRELVGRYRQRRKAAYEEFVTDWQESESTRFRGRLLTLVETGGCDGA